MTELRNLVLLCALSSVAGCVTPTSETQAPEQDRTVVASNTPADAETDAAGTPTAGAADAVQPAVVMQETAVAGKTEVGEKVYCRRRAPIGSRLPVTKCVTEEQRRENEEFAKKIFKNRDLRK